MCLELAEIAICFLDEWLRGMVCLVVENCALNKMPEETDREGHQH